MQRKLTVEWVAKEGSIFTRDTVPLKIGSKTIHVQETIAFNIGEGAEYIVKLHNLRVCKDQCPCGEMVTTVRSERAAERLGGSSPLTDTN